MTVRFGVVGLGMGKSRSRLIQQTPGIELAAICDCNEDLARRVSAELGNVEYLTAYEDLLDRNDVDCVVIMTPSGMHAEMAMAAAQAGKHILCTKPMDVTVQACDQMIQAAQEHGVKLAIDYECRYQLINCRHQHALAKGWFGRPLFAEMCVKWYRDQRYYDKNDGWRGTWKMDGGGALANQGSHLLDALLWFMGPVKSVYADTATIDHDIETEDIGLAIVEFCSGAKGLINATTTFPVNHAFDIEFHGTLGGAALHDMHAAGKKQAQSWFREGVEIPNLDEVKVDPVSCAAEDMARYIEKDVPPRVTGQDGRNVAALLGAIYESARRNRKIDL